MHAPSADVRRISAFYAEVYGETTSVQEVLCVFGSGAGKSESIKPADLYTRALDCQNHGGYQMLQRIAAVADDGALGAGMRALDVGCGVGGPARFLADRYGCRITGIDVVPERVKHATALTKLTGLARRVSHRQADAIALPFPDATFHQVWMLDASMHVRDKSALFGQLACVIMPSGPPAEGCRFGGRPNAAARQGAGPFLNRGAASVLSWRLSYFAKRGSSLAIHCA